MVLKIELFQSGAGTVMVLTGSIASPDVQHLKAHIEEAPGCSALDLREVHRVDLDAAHFLASLQERGIELRGPPPYVREWIRLETPRVVELRRGPRANAPETPHAKD
ncbi:MAG TPA: hypothetical protein VLV56_01550 [Burkholderiales bacterium]|nr:hypothetical protein [Burkholderiales bacterium]